MSMYPSRLGAQISLHRLPTVDKYTVQLKLANNSVMAALSATFGDTEGTPL